MQFHIQAFSSSFFQRGLSILLGLLCLVQLSACGFHLRGDYQLPDRLSEIAILAPEHSETAQLLSQAFATRGINVLEFDKQLAHIELLEEKIDRRILSILISGQVAEYEFLYTLKVRFTQTNGTTSEQDIILSRDYQDDPNFALAKAREFELMVREVRQEAVQRILILANQYL